MAEAMVLQHADHESPGAILDLLALRGLGVDARALHRGAAIPRPDAGALWVVMGGPMGVGDAGDPRYPFLAPEAQALRERLERRLPTLGVCLGAQLMAHASGARVFANARVLHPGAEPTLAREVGWGPVRLLGGRQEPAFRGLGRDLLTLHWHGDTFDLPLHAVHLAATALCPHQAFRIGHHVYAVQFHPEIDARQARIWTELDADFVRAARGPQGPGLLLAETRRCAARAARQGGRLLANILAAMGFGAHGAHRAARGATARARCSTW